MYPLPDIWIRATVWKLPLLQLVVQFALTPMGSWGWLFAVVRLIGDPLNTLFSLLKKLDMCQTKALKWRKNLKEPVEWKAFTLIEESCEEVGEGQANLTTFRVDCPKDVARAKEIGALLAADRTNKPIPVFISLLIFMGSIGISFVRALTGKPTSKLNIEAHSIAFSALYFYIISVVFLNAMIGTPQTEGSMRRILEREGVLGGESRRSSGGEGSHASQSTDQLGGGPEGEGAQTAGNGGDSIHQNTDQLKDPPKDGSSHTAANGGDHTPQRTYQPISIAEEAQTVSGAELVLQDAHQETPQDADQQVHPTLRGFYCWLIPEKGYSYRDFAFYCLSITTITIGPICSSIISWNTPPEGWGCRHYAFAAVVVLYFISDILNHHIRKFQKPLYWLFAKDAFFAICNLAMLGSAQFGIFNSCFCWTRFGTVPMPLPGEPEVDRLLLKRFRVLYMPLALMCVGVQIIVSIGCFCMFFSAIRVLIQRDDGKSNIPRLRSRHERPGRVESGRGGIPLPRRK
ncbi:MAG: hypothetical protein M1839_005207 [Geoglossum umbratile]|nr:MAG: hypothetical protein M1839_005207 [Geoglossum umbratile]